jgi:hypothetical protein
MFWSLVARCWYSIQTRLALLSEYCTIIYHYLLQKYVTSSDVLLQCFHLKQAPAAFACCADRAPTLMQSPFTWETVPG